MKGDNYITSEDKARWGFGGSKSEITIGSESETQASAESEGSESNLTKAQIQEQLKDKGIEFDSSANKAELQSLLDESQGE